MDHLVLFTNQGATEPCDKQWKRFKFQACPMLGRTKTTKIASIHSALAALGKGCKLFVMSWFISLSMTLFMISLTKTYWWSGRISKSPHLEFRFGGFSIVELVVTTGLPRLMHRLACLRAVVLHLNLGHKYKLHRLFFGTLSCLGKSDHYYTPSDVSDITKIPV